jgi:predicted kinase
MAMLILLGGFLGSGRKVLARRLAKKHGLYPYDMEQHKLHGHFFNKKGEVVEYSTVARTDEGRMRIYRQALQDFPRLSKMHPDVIIERTFHRKGPREYFFTEARNYFDPVIFVWVTSDGAYVQKRLSKMSRKRLVASVDTASRERETAEREFQPFETEPVTFFNEGNADEAAERLWALIQEAAPATDTKSLSGT